MDIKIKDKKFQIRRALPEDYSETEILTRDAFWNVYRPGCDEHLVIHNIRRKICYIPELDYVILDRKKIIGNIIYSKSYITDASGNKTQVISFGPISVHPSYQKQGVGTALVRFTCEKAKNMGYKAIFITGSENYYSRFGFETASLYGVHLNGVPVKDKAEFFMVKFLNDSFKAECKGIFNFDSCFNVNSKDLEEFEKRFPKRQKREPRDTDLT